MEISIRSIAGGGDGVGTLEDGRTCFVPRTAPGDRVAIRLTRDRKRWARGEVLEVLSPGPLRRAAPCPLYAECGGCSLQHLDYDAQVEAKRDILVETLRRIGGVEIPPPAVHPAPEEFRYRNRATFTLRRLGRGRVLAGFHQAGNPGRLVDVGGECLLLEPPLLDAWVRLRDAWGPGARNLPAGRELRLALRVAGAGVILGIRGGSAPGDPQALLEEIPALAEVWWGGEKGPYTLLARRRAGSETWSGEEIALGPSAFLQVNRAGGEILEALVLGAIPEPEGTRVVDAYCGVGSLGRKLAGAGAAVVGIEWNAEAVAIASDGKPEGFEVLEGAVEALLPDALPADVVILNPPRTGVAEEVPEALRAHPPSRLVYVSCDPATLARDVARLGPGFEVVDSHLVDLFPQTAHMETILVIEHAQT